jgi:hypothetical protein
MTMAKEVKCGCGDPSCTETFNIQTTCTIDGRPAVCLETCDPITGAFVGVFLDARAMDAIQGIWYEAVARRETYKRIVDQSR